MVSFALHGRASERDVAAGTGGGGWGVVDPGAGGCNEVVAAASTMPLSVVHCPLSVGRSVPLWSGASVAGFPRFVSFLFFRIIQIEKRTRPVKTPTAVNISLQVHRGVARRGVPL